MPAFDASSLSDAALEDLLAYLGTSARGAGEPMRHESCEYACVVVSTAAACCRAPLRSRRRAESLESGVTAADIAAGFADPTRWLTFSGDYTRPAAQPAQADHAAQRAHGSAPQWTFQSGTYARGRGFETTPLALDGVLYVTGSNGYAWAHRCAHGPAVLGVSAHAAGRSHVRRAARP